MKTDLSSLTRLSLLLLLFLTLCPRDSGSTEQYARETGLGCQICHIDGIGGPLTEAGKNFLEKLKTRGDYKSLTLIRRIVRLIIGYLHILAAIMWFGTIMYVHILLKPAYASKGLPSGELRVGLISMLVVLITGILLTLARVTSLETFYSTKFGILLGIKIFLFLLMFSSALIVATYIRPRLRRKMQSPVADLIAHSITQEQLVFFDGKEGRQAYIGYKGIVYDVSHARLWKNGFHAIKHPAGVDLTDSLKNAPHDEDKILAMPQIGVLSKESQESKPPFYLRLFYFFAYMNLFLVFLITFVIAMLKWW